MIVKGSDFTPCPEGVCNGVCVDVVDLGIVDGNFGPKHMLKVVWETDQLMDDGRPFIVNKRYSASLNEKSNLFKDLKAWRGKPFTSDELRAFDMEKVIGAPCQLVIVHNDKDGSVFANVQTIIKAGATRLAPTGKYTRVKDRPPEQQPVKNGGHGSAAPRQEVAEEIPF